MTKFGSRETREIYEELRKRLNKCLKPYGVSEKRIHSRKILEVEL